MANKTKYRATKNKKYYCVECERSTIDHRGDDEDLKRHCKVCKKETLFVPSDEEW